MKRAVNSPRPRVVKTRSAGWVVLKSRVTKAEFEALDALEQGHYRQDGSRDEWVLETDESKRLETALKSERRLREEGDRLLAEVVPAIVDENSTTGFVDRKKWRSAVRDRAMFLEELQEGGFDIEEWRDRPEGGGDGDPKDKDKPNRPPQGGGDQAAEVRRLTRELKTTTKERDDARRELDEERATTKRLAFDGTMNKLLDDLKVVGAVKRKAALALLKDRGYEVRDGEVFIRDDDGAEVPASEFGRSWADTEEGKEFVSAAGNSGGGDGGESDDDRRRAVRKEAAPPGGKNWRDMSPREKIAYGLGKKPAGSKR